ncbi:MAG: GTP-binding protein YchF [Candidatus Berkelbacteria bacterium Gr01-1014_85]|uniref:Ribosome-binding ATPase YchF n=1 Tax=Candidatus Berkelbacteria bacterium Gr01-1014_85 TaxID=2017150 RepID=A0A554JDI2_9BACT|nr:MAG: GTP-binding protein YchF [Candidatus Berkelbacteria bacterium Gr01-1014_85]
MSLKIGIVGLPNVGKSTLFNALVRRQLAEAANHPFTTIEPNVGQVELPDSRLDRLAEIVKPAQIVPALVKFVDIAGIIKGASLGQGLGNQFLAHIRETDALVMVVRGFQASQVIHVAGRIDPRADAEVVLTELILADLATLSKRLESWRKERPTPGQAILSAAERQLLLNLQERALANLDAGRLAKVGLSQEEIKLLSAEIPLLTLKPMLIVANVDEAEAGLTADQVATNWQLSDWLNEQKLELLPLAVQTESELVGLEYTEAADYLASLNLVEPGLNRLIRHGFNLLKLQTFFTAGPKEVRAWTVSQECPAPLAAGVIHTDFTKAFIRAEVISFQDYVEYQGEAGAKAAGRWRSEGKDYLVQDGDVINFRVGV